MRPVVYETDPEKQKELFQKVSCQSFFLIQMVKGLFKNSPFRGSHSITKIPSIRI